MNLLATPLYLSTLEAGFEADFQARLHWSAQADAAIEQRVAEILADVQQRGDVAVLEYTCRFDALDAPSVAALALSPAELRQAFDAIPQAQRQALQAAAQRVRAYHEAQKRAARVRYSGRCSQRCGRCSSAHLFCHRHHAKHPLGVR